jgi:glycosyltransferase involved in cell wall biosynthesis
VDGLAQRFDLELVGRAIPHGHVINHPVSSTVPVTIGPASRVRFGLFLLRTLMQSRGRYDLILVQGYAIAALVTNLWARLAGVPAAMLVCSPAERYYACRRQEGDPAMPFRRTAYAGLRTLAAANAVVGRHYVALSHYLADVVRSHGASGRVDVVPVYGVNTSVFRPSSSDRGQLRAALGLPATGTILLFSSRVAPEKDARTLLKAFALLRAAGVDAWIVNRSGGFEAFARLASELGLRDRVIASGPLHPTKELPALYQAADICVQASRDEGLGFSALESLACGTPVIASFGGDLRETVLDGRTGWSYEQGDVEGLATAIRTALEDPAEGRRRAIAGRALVETRFEEATVFDELHRLLARTSVTA